MSGILGIWHVDGKLVPSKLLEDMAESMRHRGPDGTGVWIKDTVGLAHLKLNAVPESIADKQPYTDIESSLTIVADARIDNRAELLCNGLVLPSDAPDSLYILEAYKKWGERCPEYLLGDFAFVIWDERQQLLYGAIDCFRQKPLCYLYSDRVFVFSSQLSGLLASGYVSSSFNDIKLASLFIDEIADLDTESSIYKEACYLPPASCFVMSQKGFDIKQYWDPADIKAIHLKNDDEYQQGLLTVLQASVKSRVRCDSDIGLMLSGGIDSTSVGTLSEELLSNSGHGLVTVSALSGEIGGCRESRFVQQAIAATKGRSITMEPGYIETSFSKLIEMIDRFDTPELAGNVMLYSLYHEASRHGLKVVLDGFEGDTMFGLGPGYLSYYFRHGQILQGINEVKLRCKNTGNGEWSLAPGLYYMLKNLLIPDWVRRVGLKSRALSQCENLLGNSIMSTDFAKSITLKELLISRRSNGLKHRGLSPNQQQINMIKRPFMSRMPVSEDAMASACSVEPRHPFYDRRLVEYALGMPWQQKNSGGWEKLALRHAMKGYVPDSIRWRKGRQHVGWEYDYAMVHMLGPRLESGLCDKSNAVYEYVDHDKVSRAYGLWKAGKDEDSACQLLQLYGLSQWLSKH